MNISRHLKRVTAALAIGMAVGGCATQSNSNSVYSGGQVQREQIVRLGVVESVRQVAIQRQDSGVGTLAGAGLGGVAGSAIGQGRGSIVGAIVGAVAGGVAGNAIENSADRRPGYELTVRLDNGEMRAIVQDADEFFQPGDRVRILSRGGISRVTH